jgi:tripartite ATP-independent transporter DctM subunit
LGPALPLEERPSLREKIISLKGVILPLLLIFSVIGSIFLGVATPTEAASVGAVGSLACALINRRLTWKNFKESSRQSLVLSTMILWIVITAACFSNIYTAIGAPDFLNDLIVKSGFGKWAILIIIQLTFLFLGMFMDPAGIVMITTPIYVPIISSMGFDPVWFGILFIINMEMGYVTPPFGYNLFYMRSIVPHTTMSMREIYL